MNASGAGAGMDLGSVVTDWQTTAKSAGASAWQAIGTSYTFKAWFLTTCGLLILADIQPGLAGKAAMLIFIAVLIRVLVLRR
jgi:hypothetical protein